MVQHGQVFKLKTRGADGKPLWAYRYRVDGRGSARPQVSGFASRGEVLRALAVELERLQRRNGQLAQLTLSELVEEYLAHHEAEPHTIAKLRWLLAKASAEFGDRRVLISCSPPSRRRRRAALCGYPHARVTDELSSAQCHHAYRELSSSLAIDELEPGASGT